MDEASIDRDDTLIDYPVQSDQYGEDGEVELVIPEDEETGDLETGDDVTVAE